ncbi:MAG TPA: hypothetical protein EYN26_08130 [Chromatiales bacterium]|nr:hypothetical protein [Chromatiaceae bacterium]HIO14913.1 hypothetical protein [Chromatiales bacterium]HIO55093.1 hypothetical protein [Chromatiales bacterium]
MKIRHGLPFLLVGWILAAQSTQAMGLRSFVALPVDKGGQVARLQYQRNTDANADVLVATAALGLGRKQTLLLGLPYRLSPGGVNRTGDLGVLYRHILWQDDRATGTRRFGLLGGAVIPTDSDRDARLQVGGVATFYIDRTEWDIDALWVQGLGDAGNRARYDIAWQYRLSPAVYPDWGIEREWALDLELGGRWQQGNTLVHQVTVGVQSIHRRWVFEAGVVQDLNGADDTQLIVSTRVHF